MTDKMLELPIRYCSVCGSRMLVDKYNYPKTFSYNTATGELYDDKHYSRVSCMNKRWFNSHDRYWLGSYDGDWHIETSYTLTK